jgi:hypothetical protein
VDRVLLKEALGFRTISANALDATGDRDFVAEVLFALTLVATHISRLGAELVLYGTQEFGFVRLADEYSTGSSLLPQKRNPDIFELARAKAARLTGDLVALLGTLKGVPAGYSKDLQEDKPLLFDAFDTLGLVLPAVTGALATLTVVPERMAAALDASLRATDLADHLVQAGILFREPRLVGKLVRERSGGGTRRAARGGGDPCHLLRWPPWAAGRIRSSTAPRPAAPPGRRSRRRSRSCSGRSPIRASSRAANRPTCQELPLPVRILGRLARGGRDGLFCGEEQACAVSRSTRRSSP